MRPLIYLELRQLANSIRNITRSPKRLIPVIIIVASTVGSFINSLFWLAGGVERPQGPQLDLIGSLPSEVVEAIVFIALSIGSVAIMYGAFSSGLLVFSIAHIDFMFPTPISRRKVLLVKLVKDYLKYALYVAVLFIFMGSPIYARLGVSMMPDGLVSILAVLALIIVVVNLAHTINIVFTFGFERLKQAASLVKAVLILAPVSAFALAAHKFAQNPAKWKEALSGLESSVIGTIFAPAMWCAKLVLAPLKGITPNEWGLFGLLWLLAGASFALLMSRKENVYEPSLGISVKFAKRRLAMRTRDFTDIRVDAMKEKGDLRARGWSIPAFGLGATAFLWKNLVLRHRVYRSQLWLMILLPLVIVFLVKEFLPERFLKDSPLMLAYMMWILAMTSQGEMRSDLRYANVVKSMPVAAWKVIATQVMSSTIYLTGGILLFSGYLWLLAPPARNETLLAFMIGIPFVGFANVAAAAIPSLMYPDMKDVTQNYLCGMVSFLLTAFVIGPTIVLVVALWSWFELPILIIVIPVALLNLLLGAAGVSIAGGIFHSFDPTSE